MMAVIFGSLLILLGLVAMALQRFYSSVPAKELKRLAARGDHLASALFRPVAYGASMRLLLWVVVAGSIAGGLLFVVPNVPGLVAFAATVLTLTLMIFLQSIRLTVRSAHMAMRAAPALHWLLTHLHPVLDVVTRFINRLRGHEPHSGLYEKEDLVALLTQQKEQVDNRIAAADLDLLERAVRFDDRQAADVVLPMSRVKLVNVSDHIGPVLLGELHASGQSSFLVYDDTPANVVGTLSLREAASAKAGGRVAELMHPRVCYVHEDFTLRQVLQAFTATSQFITVVINAFEEPVGVITIQHLLTQLIGER
ncbi:MAG TPA: CBS domain-containing protein, partial [Candidatus Saccharimonadales bacterium]|nr:CBS domain-containing protein [Candidatus Saccharimonadales bacterium]